MAEVARGGGVVRRPGWQEGGIRPFADPYRLAWRIALIVTLACLAGNGFFWFDSYFSGVCDAVCAHTPGEAIWKTLVFGALWALVLVPTVTLLATPVVHRSSRVFRPFVGPSGAIVLASLLAVILVIAVGTMVLLLFSDGAYTLEKLTTAARLVGMLAVPGVLAMVAVFVLRHIWERIRMASGGNG